MVCLRGRFRVPTTYDKESGVLTITHIPERVRTWDKVAVQCSVNSCWLYVWIELLSFACCLPLYSGMHLFCRVLRLTGSIELCNKAATA